MTNDKGRRTEPHCIADKHCILTVGFYIGGGMHICWLHAMTVPGMLKAVAGQEMVGLKGKRDDPTNRQARAGEAGDCRGVSRSI